MLYLTIPKVELYDEKTNTFYETKEQKISLEHSLISLSKWESKWKKPFLNQRDKHTVEESMDYIKCMTITQNVPDVAYRVIMSSNELSKMVTDYIDDPMTATWFGKEAANRGPTSRRIVTSELIYYWMTQFNIPFECEKWHLNRLLTLIKVCDEEQKPPQKLSGKALAERNTALNAQRLAAAKRKIH